MPQAMRNGHCRHCGDGPVVRQTPSYLLHVILVILTAGLWLIVLVPTALGGGGAWRCAQCGRLAAPGATKTADGVEPQISDKVIAGIIVFGGVAALIWFLGAVVF
jgi:hypothetical protein